MKAYLDLVRTVLAHGTRKPNRTGVDTISVFNHNYEIDLRNGFPLLTTKEISWKNVLVENLWFISGQPEISLLRKHNCRFWDPWADPSGRVPSAYGAFWRHFPTSHRGSNDQLAWVIEEIRRNPESRRLVVSAWAPENAQTSRLPPCHAMFVFNVQRRDDGEPELCLHLTQRSADVALGVPYNIAGYAFILELDAQLTGLRPGRFGHTLIDAHVYTAKTDGSMAEHDHVPGLREQLTRDPRPLPRLVIDSRIRSLADVEHMIEADTGELLEAFRIEGYAPHPAITFKVAV